MRSRSSPQGENDIQIQIVAKLSDKEYGENELIHLVLEIHLYIITINILKTQMKMIWEKH